MRQSVIKHDYIKVYRYGEKALKIVYFKYQRVKPYVEYSESLKEYLEECYDDTPFEVINRQKYERFISSISRARSTIFELALCNNFEWFCTFTVDKEKGDRFDLKSFRSRLSQFIRNQNRYRESSRHIKFLLIPEHHQNGAWHMHGLLSGLDDNDLSINEYGYLDWIKYRDRFGFFSCSRIKSHEACSRYITKYVSKSMFETTLKSGEHLFFASKGLKRKEVVSIDDFPLESEDWDFENDYVKIKWKTLS